MERALLISFLIWGILLELSQRQAGRREERPWCTSTQHNRRSESNSHDRTTDELHDDLGDFASSSSSR